MKDVLSAFGVAMIIMVPAILLAQPRVPLPLDRPDAEPLRPRPVVQTGRVVMVDGARISDQYMPKQADETIISAADAITTKVVVVDVPTTRTIRMFWFDQDTLTTGSRLVVVDAVTTGTEVRNIVKAGVRFDRMTGNFLQRAGR